MFPFSDLLRLRWRLLYDLNLLLTDEVEGQQVVQDALHTPQSSHQQLSVIGQDIQAGRPDLFYQSHVYCTLVTSEGQKGAQTKY